MSRTVHHVPKRCWNGGAVEHAAPGDPRDPRSVLTHVVYDLRFAAGCRGVPRRVRVATARTFPRGWFSSDGLAEQARQRERASRAAWRDFAVGLVAAHRGGASAEQLADYAGAAPEARHRHSVLYDL